MTRSPLIGQKYREDEMQVIFPQHELIRLEGDNRRYAGDFTEERIVWITDEGSVKIYICKY